MNEKSKERHQTLRMFSIRRSIVYRDDLLCRDTGRRLRDEYTKDIYARAVSIKTGNHYTCHDFRGGIDGRVATEMNKLLNGTGYRIEEKNDEISELIR